MSSCRSFLTPVMLLHILLAFFTSVSTCAMRGSQFAPGTIQGKGLEDYEEYLYSDRQELHGNTDVFDPKVDFSNYLGSVHIWKGVAPKEDRYICGMAYITMRSGRYTSSGSGVLVSKKKIITAAHIFVDIALENVKVYLGDRIGGTSAAVGIKNIYRLKSFNPNRLRSGNDIAIIDLSVNQRTACSFYWQDRESVNTKDGDVVTTLGYGDSYTFGHFGNGAGTLRQTSLRIAENGHTLAGHPACAQQSSSAQLICAVSPGYPYRNQGGTCIGDSGGPLIKDDGTYKWLIGVNSFSNTDCNRPGNIDIFSRVYAHHHDLFAIVYKGNTSGWNAIH